MRPRGPAQRRRPSLPLLSRVYGRPSTPAWRRLVERLLRVDSGASHRFLGRALAPAVSPQGAAYRPPAARQPEARGRALASRGGRRRCSPRPRETRRRDRLRRGPGLGADRDAPRILGRGWLRSPRSHGPGLAFLSSMVPAAVTSRGAARPSPPQALGAAGFARAAGAAERTNHFLGLQVQSGRLARIRRTMQRGLALQEAIPEDAIRGSLSALRRQLQVVTPMAVSPSLSSPSLSKSRSRAPGPTPAVRVTACWSFHRVECALFISHVLRTILCRRWRPGSVR